MNNRINSAVQRTPQEVWWMILDEAIDVPLLFGTMYEGNDWSRDARRSRRDLYKSYGVSEKQRKIIGSVCRSWQIFARSKRNRVVVAMNTRDWGMEKIQKAREIFLRGTYVLDPSLAQDKSVEWESLRINDPRVLSRIVSALSCPRLRRLELGFSDDDPPIYDTLRLLPDITWLDCDVSFREIPATASSNNPPIVLPKLEVFRSECERSFVFPLSNFAFPSLRYIYIRFSVPITDISLLDILIPCRHSIQSVVLRMAEDSLYSQIIQFPPWTNFPKLKELELDQQWSVRFEPLPPSHPLQKLDAQHDSFDVISSLLDGMNMRQLILQRARWTTTGGLMGTANGMTMKVKKGKELWKIANARRIQFKVTQYGTTFQERPN